MRGGTEGRGQPVNKVDSSCNRFLGNSGGRSRHHPQWGLQHSCIQRTRCVVCLLMISPPPRFSHRVDDMRIVHSFCSLNIRSKENREVYTKTISRTRCHTLDIPHSRMSVHIQYSSWVRGRPSTFWQLDKQYNTGSNMCAGTQFILKSLTLDHGNQSENWSVV